MTKAERAVVRWAITEIMAEDGKFHEAVHKLCGLVGMRYPAYDAMKKARAVPLRELLTSKEEADG